jgi:hypothetical protein
VTDLLTIDDLIAELATTEPITRLPFSVGGIHFWYDLASHHGMRARPADEPVKVYASIDGTEVELTRTCFEEVCSLVGLKRSYVTDCPANLLVPHLNHWYGNALLATTKPTDFQFFVRDRIALAFTKQKVVPFSNLKLLDQARDAFRALLGDAEILVDVKRHHDLRRTVFRLFPATPDLVLPNGDTWSTGLQVRNSLTGRTQTSIDRYLYRWLTGAGQIDSGISVPPFTRRASAAEDEVYGWARHAMDDVLRGSIDSLKAVDHLTQVQVPAKVSQLLRDVFEHERVPLTLRAPIIDNVTAHDGDLSMYDIMNAIAVTANQPDLDPASVELLMRVAGRLPYTGESRCDACDRLLHHH